MKPKNSTVGSVKSTPNRSPKGNIKQSNGNTPKNTIQNKSVTPNNINKKQNVTPKNGSAEKQKNVSVTKSIHSDTPRPKNTDRNSTSGFLKTKNIPIKLNGKKPVPLFKKNNDNEDDSDDNDDDDDEGSDEDLMDDDDVDESYSSDEAALAPTKITNKFGKVEVTDEDDEDDDDEDDDEGEEESDEDEDEDSELIDKEALEDNSVEDEDFGGEEDSGDNDEDDTENEEADTEEDKTDLSPAQKKSAVANKKVTAKNVEDKHWVLLGGLDNGARGAELKNFLSRKTVPVSSITLLQAPLALVELNSAKAAETVISRCQGMAYKSGSLCVARLQASAAALEAMRSGGATAAAVTIGGNVSSNTLHINNIAKEATDSDLRAVIVEILDDDSQLIEVKLFQKQGQQNHRGNGTASFKSAEAAKMVLETLQGHELAGQKLKVSYFVERGEKPNASPAAPKKYGAQSPGGDNSLGETRTVGIFNLPHSYEIERLKEDLVPDAEDAFIPRDRDTQKSRGFAIVKFATHAEAKEVVARLQGKEIDGRELRVELREERDGGGGRGGGRGGGFRGGRGGGFRGGRGGDRGGGFRGGRGGDRGGGFRGGRGGDRGGGFRGGRGGDRGGFRGGRGDFGKRPNSFGSSGTPAKKTRFDDSD